MSQTLCESTSGKELHGTGWHFQALPALPPAANRCIHPALGDPLALVSFWRRWENGGDFSPTFLVTSCSHLAALSLNQIISTAPQRDLRNTNPFPQLQGRGAKMPSLLSPPPSHSSLVFSLHAQHLHTSLPPQKIRKKATFFHSRAFSTGFSHELAC